ncbi:hypothetical protein [Treponema sp.]|uniref:hypothetical protein n=1 Tax=Treponema sp. TaxID=166 RepID=UPI00298DFD7C|nr:hypothetical protein [Treponema sp.]MCR5613833.1 hypothetical protein [Treponema sp.]
MDKGEYSFNRENLEDALKTFAQKKITEFYVHDEKLASDKKLLIHFLKSALREAPDVYYNIRINADIIDNEVIQNALELFCSFEIPLTESKNNIEQKDKKVFLFDKKLYSKKAALLNNAGVVFGFDLDFALSQGDSFKAFRDRVDFALTLYPNHIDFPQLESDTGAPRGVEKCTGTYSSQDISYSKKIASAVKIFYTMGRAVPWFNIVLNPLKIAPSKFFSDFAEWLECNNVPFLNSEKTQKLSHREIEKMQLLFLEMKFEEKHKEHLFVIARDIVSLYGAFSRVDQENEETVLNLSFNPDDLLSPASLNLSSFSDNVCMEDCRIKVYAGEQAPEYDFV